MNDLSLHILDIVQNSISANATLIDIIIAENLKNDRLSITIKDNGKGMTPEQVERVTDPYFTSRTTRKVGLGLPLFKQSAKQTGGDLVIESEVGKGTTVTATFGHRHIDRPSLGDTANAVILLVSANPEIDFVYEHLHNENNYVFDTREVKEALDGLPLNDVHIIKMLTEMIQENLKEIYSA